MKLRAVSGIMLMLFMFSMLTLAFNIQLVMAQGTIYIRADGSVDPPTAPIQRDGDLYTLTGNITIEDQDGIGIERDGTTLDGAGFTLKGTGAHTGIVLLNRHNVTIKNTKIQAFSHGISLNTSSYNYISENHIVNNDQGIWLYSSSYNSISKNNIAKNDEGISDEELVSPGKLSFYNSISENNITANNNCGILLSNSGTSNTMVYQNNITNNYGGIYIVLSSNNKIHRNNFINNTVQAESLSIDLTVNTWDDGYPLGGNYWSDYSVIDEKSGPNQDQLGNDGIGDKPYIINADNRDRYPLMSISKAWIATFISISTSSPSTLLGFSVNITGNLSDAYGSSLENKTVVIYYTFSGANAWVPITSDITDYLGHYSVKWIPPATGYFTVKAEWAGNTTHCITSNTVTLSTIPYESRFVFSVESNSTISALAFNTASRELSFNASGSSGTKGYVKIIIAKTLIDNIADVKVYLDGDQLNYTATSEDDSWQLHFTYLHSTHTIAMNLGLAPFIPPQLISPLSLGILALALAVATVLLIFKIRKGTPPTILNGVFRKSKQTQIATTIGTKRHKTRSMQRI